MKKLASRFSDIRSAPFFGLSKVPASLVLHGHLARLKTDLPHSCNFATVKVTSLSDVSQENSGAEQNRINRNFPLALQTEASSWNLAPVGY
jgi:hypothetical protein